MNQRGNFLPRYRRRNWHRWGGVTKQPETEALSRPRPRKKPSGGSSPSRWGNSKAGANKAATANGEACSPLSFWRVASTISRPEAAHTFKEGKILTEGGLSPILAQMEAANLGSKLLTLFWGYNKELFSYGTKRKRTPNTKI